ncbi:MAG: hypothetical protein U1E73_01470 [Planctomycetota bacterium]
MNCNNCRYELSQCLDGRLPSGRRTIVMQHVATCTACAGFWDELQAAQKLVLELPRQRVGGAFRDQLWDRIRAGEGTPEAVFHEPVPMVLKVRYALVGAAAAAAMLLAGLWLHSEDDRQPDHRNEVAKMDNRPVAPTPGPTATVVHDDTGDLSGSVPLLSSAQPLTSSLFATEAARQLENRYYTLDSYLRQLDKAHAASADLVVDRAFRAASDLHELADVLLRLRDCDRVFFRDDDVGAQLLYAHSMLGDPRMQSRDLATVRTFLAPTVQRAPRLRTLSQDITLPPAANDTQVENETLYRINYTYPDVFQKLFFSVGQDLPAEQTFGVRIFVFQGDCGLRLVTPRSKIR